MTRMQPAAAVVTGHSRGLGAAIARELLDRRFRVMGISRSGNTALTNRRDALVEVRLDLSDLGALDEWLAAGAMRAFLADAGQVLLVNNAGLLEPIGNLEQQVPSDAARAVTVNVAAALALSAAFADAARDCPDRRILHISSGAARHAYAGWSVYCATKAALDHHARAVAEDGLAGLRISSVAPGVIDTDMQAEIRAVDAGKFPDKERFVTMQREGALRRPEDAARSVVDLLLSAGFGRDVTTEVRR